MRRYLTLILVLSLLLPCLVVPASATDANVVDAIHDQTQSLKDFLSSRWSEIDAWWQTYISLINDKLLNIRNYIQSLLNYFTADTEIFILVDSDGDGVNEIVYISEFYKDFLYMQNYLYNYLWSPVVSWFTNANEYFFGAAVSYPGAQITKDATTGKFKLRSITYFGTQFQRDLGMVSYDIVYGLCNAYIEIHNRLLELVSGDSAVSDSIQDQVNQDSTEASEYLDIMDDVTKPDVGELEDLSDISGYVNAGDVSALSDVLKPLFDSSVFLPCIMLNLTFMLVGYALFGKR